MTPTEIFPTQIFTYSNADAFNCFASIKDLSFDNCGSQADKSSDTHLEKNEKFTQLFRWINFCLEDHRIKLNYSCDKFEISQAWVNKSEHGQFHHIHVHPNSFISGIYYFDKATPTYFQDPRQSVLSTGFNVECDGDNTVWEYCPTENTLLLFPSWLPHFTMPNPLNEQRYTLAINVIPTGLVNQGSLTELNIRPSN